jgi:hypothetical protein
MFSFMISCKKSDLLSNSFVLIALNAKAINSFDEKDANKRVNERTKERKSAYKLRKKNKYNDEKKNIWNDDDDLEKMKLKKNEKRNKKRNKKRKENVLIAFRLWWCDVLKTRYVFSFSKIYEEYSLYFVLTRWCFRSFSSTFLRDLKFDIANVVEKTFIRTMKEKKIIINN